MAKFMLMKQRWYPRPHDIKTSIKASARSALVDYQTIIPIAMYDEGLGSPKDYSSNPENPNFSVSDGPNCYPSSRINMISTKLTISLTKVGITTDAIPALRVGYMPIFLSFKEDYEANDEKSTLDVSEILELQKESTDRQGYPLWNGTKVAESYTNSGVLGTNVPGLTTNQKIEGIAFDIETFYDAVHYYTNSGKLKAVQGGMKWITLTKEKNYKNIEIYLRKKSKRMNPYSFFGVLVVVPQVDTRYQLPFSTDATIDAKHVRIDCITRYNEWNDDFEFARIDPT